MRWQFNLLKKLHEGPIDYFEDRIATNGFYDLERFRFHGENLYKVYELLYPRDQRYISLDVLHIAGEQGLAMLWFDQGRVKGRRGSLRGRYSPREYQNIADYLNSIDIQATPHSNQLTTIEICLSRAGLDKLLRTIAPLLPKGSYSKVSRSRTTSRTLSLPGA